MSEESPDVQVYVGSFVAGFFDLLGQQDRLREIHLDLCEESEEQLQRLRESIKNSYGVVVGFRNVFQLFFDGFSESDGDLTPLTEEQRAEYRAYTAHEIQMQPMSDSVLVYTPACGPGGKVSLKGIFGLLAAAAGSMLTCLAAGHPLRGGIDLGTSMIVDNKEFYGPALARAYALESKIAQYPRIVVGKELIEFLEVFARSGSLEIEHQMAKQVATACLELCADDVDGEVFIDFLGPGAKKHLGQDIDSSVVAAAIKHVFRSQEKAKAAHNQILGFRYALLSDYCQDRAAIWGVEAK